MPTTWQHSCGCRLRPRLGTPTGTHGGKRTRASGPPPCAPPEANSKLSPCHGAPPKGAACHCSGCGANFGSRNLQRLGRNVQRGCRGPSWLWPRWPTRWATIDSRPFTHHIARRCTRTWQSCSHHVLGGQPRANGLWATWPWRRARISNFGPTPISNWPWPHSQWAKWH